VSQAELLALWGKSRETAAEWARRPGCPKRIGKSGRPEYNLHAFLEWWASERERAAAEKAKGKAPKGGSAEARYDEARARKLELEVARIEGETVSVDEAAAIVEEKLANLRAQLVTLPQRWAPGVLGCKNLMDVTTKLDTAVREAMTAIVEAT
jgi:hypothetical protein